MLISSGKREAIIDPPWMNAAGTLGFSDETASAFDLTRLGAFVTHPVSFTPRRSSGGDRLHDFPGGFLLHTGLPNPGLTAVIREHQQRWRRMPVPVIVHLLVNDPSELHQMLLQLEALDAVSAVELGIGVENPDEIKRLLAPIARSELPVIVRMNTANGWSGIEAACQLEPAALCLAPPRGASNVAGALLTGRAYGPGLFPLMLERTPIFAEALELPLLVSGGIETPSDVAALLASGADAVQLDFALWTHPTLLERLSNQMGDIRPASA